MPRARRARVVFVDLTGPGRAGPQRHGAGASRAEGEPGQKDWSSDGAGRIDPRIAIFQNRLDPIEKRWVNNDRRRNNDVLRRHFFGSRFRVHLIEPQFACIRLPIRRQGGADRLGRWPGNREAQIAPPTLNLSAVAAIATIADEATSKSLPNYAETPSSAGNPKCSAMSASSPRCSAHSIASSLLTGIMQYPAAT